MAQLMPLPLTISCSSKIQIGFTFVVLAHLGSPEQRAVKRVCVCVCVCVCHTRILLVQCTQNDSHPDSLFDCPKIHSASQTESRRVLNKMDNPENL